MVRQVPARRSTGSEAGYTLVGLLLAVAVVNVAMGVAATSWVTLDRRAREAELIWRGQQIVRAIGCYQAGDAGEPLERLEQLVEAGCLRREYPDPMSADGEWRILRQSDAQDGTLAELQGLPAVDAEGPLGTAFGSATTGLTGQESPFQTGPGGGNAIIGVMSTVEGPTQRVYAGRDRYEQWLFLAGESGP